MGIKTSIFLYLFDDSHSKSNYKNVIKCNQVTVQLKKMTNYLRLVITILLLSASQTGIPFGIVGINNSFELIYKRFTVWVNR